MDRYYLIIIKTILGKSMTQPINPEPMHLPPFIQLEQKKEVTQALVADKAAGDVKKDTKGTDFDSLMPKWMLAMGQTYSSLEQFYGSNGAMGKWLSYIAGVSSLQESFAKLVSSAGSFGALKDFFAHGSGDEWKGFQNGIGSVATAIENEFKNWTPGHSTPAQEQAAEASQYGIMNSETQDLLNQANTKKLCTDNIQQKGTSLTDDESQLANFLAGESEGYGATRG